MASVTAAQVLIMALSMPSALLALNSGAYSM
jgi:hypothetical protein